LSNDLTYLAITVAFFALAALFVIGCDKVIGSDEEALALGMDEPELDAEPLEVAA